MTASYFEPEWPLPPRVRAIITTRELGASRAPFHRNNLASHVGDDINAVKVNRLQLCHQLGITPLWMNQVHSTDLWDIDNQALPHYSDACYSRAHGNVCSVLTADCLPVLACNQEGTQVAAAHAGWRGLAGGVISNMIASFSSPADELNVYLGPAISQSHFEVGSDVLRAFELSADQRCYAEPVTASFIKASAPDKYFADLYRLARSELKGLGITSIHGGNYCTFGEPERFFSYRRDGKTGRMASLIWIANPQQ
ncbi:hypothetical protein P886_2744 [Alteromonadaceae bacterium 2753L.S.0a.02]|nr:hypothetical protein P886_2744 [Alteromonadaceae bacterium 2753L.S.0a.02]